VPDYGPRVRKALSENGCYLAPRQAKGGHELWFSPVHGRKVTVDTKIKSRHTANGVLKQAGLPKAF